MPSAGRTGCDVAEAAACARRLARFRPAGAAPAERRSDRARRPGCPRCWTAARPGRDRRAARPLVPDRGRPAAGAHRRRRRGPAGDARPQGVGAGRQRPARALRRCHRLRARASCCAAWCWVWPPPTRPLELNLVLVDFKGGATFLDFAALPHVSAVITNLADELALVDRMAAALTGEIHRRQELLRAAGNLTGHRRLRRRPARRRRAAAAARPAGGGRRVLRAARPAPGTDRPAGHDRTDRTLARPAPAAGLAAPRRGPDARAGVAPVLSHRAAHVLRGGVARRARSARRPPADRARPGLPGRGQRRAGAVPGDVRVRPRRRAGRSHPAAGPTAGPPPPPADLVRGRAARRSAIAEAGGSEAGRGRRRIRTGPPSRRRSRARRTAHRAGHHDRGDDRAGPARPPGVVAAAGPRRRRWTRCSAPIEPDPQRGLAAPGPAPLRMPYGAARPAAGPAAGPAGLRPHRRVRAPGRDRRAAVGQVDRRCAPSCSGWR